jgi:hypothetical protein
MLGGYERSEQSNGRTARRIAKATNIAVEGGYD